jgi:hypothetical protein
VKDIYYLIYLLDRKNYNLRQKSLPSAITRARFPFTPKIAGLRLS